MEGRTYGNGQTWDEKQQRGKEGHQEERTVSKVGKGTQCPATWFPVVLKHWGNFQREKVFGSTMNTDFVHCMLESLMNIGQAP